MVSAYDSMQVQDAMTEQVNLQQTVVGMPPFENDKRESTFLGQDDERIEDGQRDLPALNMKGFVLVAILTGWLHGYDVSNVANIQPRIYEQFKNIQLLPWIGLSYSLALLATLILARRLCECFNLRWLNLVFQLVFMAGAAVAGAAPNMESVIVGRIIIGLGGAVVQQCCYSYIAILVSPTESVRLISLIGICWAIGLISGGVIGTAFAENPHTTWRWSLYINIPLMGVLFIASVLFTPSYLAAPPGMSLWQRIKRIDLLGIMLNMICVVLFGIVLTFSGPIWAWDSGSAIATWVVFAVCFVAWMLQQAFCFLTTPEQRALPLHILFRRDLLPVWIANGCAGAIYGVTLYYTPLLFAFARGLSPFAQTVRLLPFIIIFIIAVAAVGALLPILRRYKYIYIAAGSLSLAGTAAMAVTVNTTVSNSQVLGLLALIGAGLGMHFNHAVPIANAILTTQVDRMDAAVMGGVASMGGLAISLIMAGAIFQNVGERLLTHVLEGHDYTRTQIQEALAGVSSVLLSGDSQVAKQVVEAVSSTISRDFYVATAAAALCLVCGLLMKDEKLEFKKTR